MATRPQPPSERDLELLSAYLDGELSDRERAALEKRLSQDKMLRAALDGLRETVTLVQRLPRLKAPRNFTLDPAVYGHSVSWWKRWFTPGSVLQVSGVLGAAASIVLFALAFLLSSPSASEDKAASVTGSQQAEIEQTAVGYVAETSLPSPTQLPTILPTASATPILAPTQSPLPTETIKDEDNTAGAEAADSAAMPTPEAAAAILIEPATEEQEAFAPPEAAGQAVEESPASEGEVDTGLFSAAPAPSSTLAAPAGAQTADDAAEEAEEPLIIATSTPAAEAMRAATATSTPSPTLFATVTATDEATLEQINGDGAAARQLSEENDQVTSSTRWIVAGLGVVIFILSAGLFIAGRRRR